MLAVPSRAGERLPHLSAHDVSVIDGEVLTEIGMAQEKTPAHLARTRLFRSSFLFAAPTTSLTRSPERLNLRPMAAYVVPVAARRHICASRSSLRPDLTGSVCRRGAGRDISDSYVDALFERSYLPESVQVEDYTPSKVYRYERPRARLRSATPQS